MRLNFQAIASVYLFYISWVQYSTESVGIYGALSSVLVWSFSPEKMPAFTDGKSIAYNTLTLKFNATVYSYILFSENVPDIIAAVLLSASLGLTYT